jgi:acetoin utilization protein AcuB
VLVRDIMTSPVAVADIDDTLAFAYARMREREIRHLPVARQGALVGVVTDRDLRLATSALSASPFAPDARLEEVMSRPVRTADPLDPVEEAARTMRQLKIGCLPVTSGAALVGIVTGVDLLDALLRLTGVLTASGRMELTLPDQPGELARLATALAAQHVNIRSILTQSDSTGSTRLVLRLGTIEVKRVAQELRAQGFAVLWPTDAPW